jgi:tetratricopeptide (TPR) repeat protein
MTETNPHHIERMLPDLDPNTRETLLAMGAFFDTHFTLELIKVYFDTRKFQTDPAIGLDSLVERDLVEVLTEDDRNLSMYRLQQAAYDYIQAQVTDDQREFALVACKKTLAIYRSQDAESIHGLMLVVEQLKAAQSWTIETKRWDAALTIGSAMHGHNDWDGVFELGIDLVKRAFNVAEQQEIPGEQARHLTRLARFYLENQDGQQALQHLYHALSIWQAEDDTYKITGTLQEIGEVYFDMGRYAEGIEVCKRSLNIAAIFGHLSLVANGWANLAILYEATEDFERAVDYNNRAIRYYWEQGSSAKRVQSLSQLGACYINMQQYEKAIPYLEEALFQFEDWRYGYVNESGLLYGRLGIAYAGVHNFDAALAHFQASHDTYADAGYVAYAAEAQREIRNVRIKIWRQRIPGWVKWLMRQGLRLLFPDIVRQVEAKQREPKPSVLVRERR